MHVSLSYDCTIDYHNTIVNKIRMDAFAPLKQYDISNAHNVHIHIRGCQDVKKLVASCLSLFPVTRVRQNFAVKFGKGRDVQ
jgi:hypothetical protein